MMGQANIGDKWHKAHHIRTFRAVVKNHYSGRIEARVKHIVLIAEGEHTGKRLTVPADCWRFGFDND